MKCDEVKKLIPGYLEGEMEGPKEAEIGQHLKVCLECQLEVRAYESSWEMLDSWQDIEAKPSYVSRFWNRMAQEKTFVEWIVLGFRSFFGNRQLVGVCTAACIVLVVGFLTMKTTIQVTDPDDHYANLSQDEIELVEHMELVENLEIIEEMDLLKDLEIMESIDVSNESS